MPITYKHHEEQREYAVMEREEIKENDAELKEVGGLVCIFLLPRERNGLS